MGFGCVDNHFVLLLISHIGFHHIETFKLVSFLFLCSCNDASVFWIYRFVSIWNLISLWSFELKSELKSSGKHNGSKSMLPIRGLGRQLSYHPYHHFMRIENAFLGKKSSFMKLGAGIGNGNRTLFLEKTQTDSEANYQKKKHHNHSWNRSNQVVCPSQLRVEALPQLPKLFCCLGIEVDRQSGAHCCFKSADHSFIVEHWVVKPIKDCFIIKPRIAKGAKPKLQLHILADDSCYAKFKSGIMISQ